MKRKVKLPRWNVWRCIAIRIGDTDPDLNKFSLLYIVPYNLVIEFFLFIEWAQQIPLDDVTWKLGVLNNESHTKAKTG